MTPTKWKHPLFSWDRWNEDPDLAFTLVARNKRTRQIWADVRNTSRYVAPSSDSKTSEDQIIIRIPSNHEDRTKLDTYQDTEPALQFLFSDLPKDLAKGYVLGSDEKSCDILLDDPGVSVCEQMLTFAFNKRHQLVMNTKLDKPASVKFKGQKLGEREQFTWIFPRHRGMIRVKAANRLEFDVVLPEYGIHTESFHKTCERFLKSATQDHLLADDSAVDGIAATEEACDTSTPQSPFYLRGMRVGRGSYGDVYQALRMPDGKVFAAKRFKDKKSFQLELKMQKRLCQTNHVRTIEQVDWTIAD